MSTVLRSEIEKFSKDAGHWWDENGPFKPLHQLNPVRMGYIRSQVCGHFGLGDTDLKPFKGLSILDVGCGGGLVCEPLARLGGDVTGIDADPVAIEVAKEHAAQAGLEINYLNMTTDDLLSPRKRGSLSPTKAPRFRGGNNEGSDLFDVVLALEIIEHVADQEAFVKSVAKLAKPGGIVIFSTLNRTPKSYALGIVAAEYVLNLVPRGTHEWKKFVKPSELAKHCTAAGLAPKDISGLVFSPLAHEFRLSKTDMGVNYLLYASK